MRSGWLLHTRFLLALFVNRTPLEQWWGEDCVKLVNRAPRNKYNRDEYADGDVPEEVVAPEVNQD